MRIAYLTGEYPRVTDTFIQREVSALRRLGATVKTFSVRSPRSPQALSTAQQAEREKTYYLLPPNLVGLLAAHIGLCFKHPKQYLQTLTLAWRTRQKGLKGSLYQLVYFIEAGLLAYQLIRQNITHLHNHFGDSSGTVAMLAAAFSGVEYSFTLHGPAIFFEPYRWRIDEKIRRAKFVSCISYFCRSQAMVFAPVEAWPRLHIVHCGVSPETFEVDKELPSEASSTPWVKSEQTGDIQADCAQPCEGRRLLFVGRLAAAKGLPILLRSLQMLKQRQPDIHLTVVGDGPDRQLLHQQAEELDLISNISFVGAQSPVAVRTYLKKADVFVMSSFAEGVPVVLMEAMMTGLPVVATRIAGVGELVEEGKSGFLVSPSDPTALAERIQMLLADAALRGRMGKYGQQTVRQSFNIDIEAAKLYQLITAQTDDLSNKSRQKPYDLDNPSNPLEAANATTASALMS